VSDVAGGVGADGPAVGWVGAVGDEAAGSPVSVGGWARTHPDANTAPARNSAEKNRAMIAVFEREQAACREVSCPREGRKGDMSSDAFSDGSRPVLLKKRGIKMPDFRPYFFVMILTTCGEVPCKKFACLKIGRACHD
jgi:hypothetical protein